MKTMRNVRVLDVKKVAYELSGPFAKVGALHRQTMTAAVLLIF